MQDDGGSMSIFQQQIVISFVCSLKLIKLNSGITITKELTRSN